MFHKLPSPVKIEAQETIVFRDLVPDHMQNQMLSRYIWASNASGDAATMRSNAVDTMDSVVIVERRHRIGPSEPPSKKKQTSCYCWLLKR